MNAARLLVVFALAILGLTLMTARPAAAAPTCDAVTADFLASRHAGDLTKAITLYGEIADAATGCNEHIIHCAGDSVARGYVEASYDAADKGASAADVQILLKKGRAYGSPWQLIVGLADAQFADARQTKNGNEFQQAAANYQDALDVINEDPACRDFDEPSPPTADQIGPIHKRMTEALLLAPTFQVVRTREGNCGGIFLASVRGFTPEFRPIPITFEFGKSTFTPEGEKAAKVLLACALDDKYKRIVMSGHTDPIGGDAYNMALSERRLEAVKTYLVKGGFDGATVLIPKGETEPFQPDDPTAYTQDQLYQLDRRVVIRETDK